jgi:hypothetical protein
MSYQKLIGEILAHAGRSGEADPRHVEGWLRLEHGCLDALSRERFVQEVVIALRCVAAASAADNEELARSYGL